MKTKADQPEILTATEALRQKFIADREAMGEAEAGAQRAFHVAHESVGSMFPGEMEPI